MNDQTQHVREVGFAVQSGRDTILQQGISPAQMAEILNALATQFPAQLAAAHQIVTERLSDFEARFLEKFQDQLAANSAAFADPDFQYVVRSCQHAYARSGDSEIRDTLIDLIARRSKEQTRTRLSLTLNEAVETAVKLTKNEFAELSLCYLLRYTRQEIGNMDQFAAYFQANITPLLTDISSEKASYQYLEAQSCGNIGLISLEVISMFRENYGGIFSKGFDKETLQNYLPGEKKNVFDQATLLIPCLNDKDKFQFGVINKKEFLEHGDKLQLSEPEMENVWKMFDGTIWNGEEFLVNVEKRIPEIRSLAKIWSDSSLKTFTLTTVGLAIGHSNLVRISKLDADLAMWVK